MEWFADIILYHNSGREGEIVTTFHIWSDDTLAGLLDVLCCHAKHVCEASILAKPLNRYKEIASEVIHS